MKVDEVCQGLELFLNKDKNEKLRGKIQRFEEDNNFLDYLAGLVKKDIRAVKIEDLIPVADVLDLVVFPDYPVENPVQYSALYKPAIINNRLEVYSRVLAHLNKVSGIEKTLAISGVEKNLNFGRQTSNLGVDQRPYVFSDECYLGYMETLLGTHGKNEIDKLNKKLSSLEGHLDHLKAQGFDLEKLFTNGYAVLLRSIDNMQAKNQGNNFSESAAGVARLIKRFDELGFDMYHGANISIVKSWVEGNRISQIEFLTEYVSKEALIYVSGLHLKNQ